MLGGIALHCSHEPRRSKLPAVSAAANIRMLMQSGFSCLGSVTAESNGQLSPTQCRLAPGAKLWVVIARLPEQSRSRAHPSADRGCEIARRSPDYWYRARELVLFSQRLLNRKVLHTVYGGHLPIISSTGSMQFRRHYIRSISRSGLLGKALYYAGNRTYLGYVTCH
jgi:hypothetical protein